MLLKIHKRVVIILAVGIILLSGFSSSQAYASKQSGIRYTNTFVGEAKTTGRIPLPADQFAGAKVDIQVDSVNELDRLSSLGYACDQPGICTLRVSLSELKELRQAGFEPLSIEEAVVVRIQKDETIQAPLDITDTSIYGLNNTNINIPDYGGGEYCGFTYSTVTISDAPANAIVTQVEYSLRVQHTYVTDLALLVSNAQDHNATVWYGQSDGNQLTGTDGGDDDDPADDYDVTFNQRLIADDFDGDSVNQDWYLDANDCVGDDTGFIDYIEFWIYYVTDPDIRVHPGSLSYTRDLGAQSDLTFSSISPSAVEISAEVRQASHERVYQMLAVENQARVIVHLADNIPSTASKEIRLDAIADQQDRVLGKLGTQDFTLTHRFTASSGFAGSVTASGMEKLLADPQVLMVYEDIVMHTSLNESVPLINADDVHDLGFTGEGVNVAVLDTGIDTDHSDLSDDLVAEKCYTQNACPGGGSQSNSAEDGDGHGTSVSGIITSRGTVAPLGVAPDAGIVAVKVLDDTGSGRMSDWVAGINWVVNNQATYDISVINMSMGGGGPYANHCDSSFPDAAAAMNAAVASGITPFIASGNETWTNGIAAPACLSASIAVGAVYDANIGPVYYSNCSDTTTAADKVTCYSNSSSLVDILAPSTRNLTTGLGGGTDSNFGGTSAASPHAAAVAALMIDANPTLTPQMIETGLEDNGVLVTDHRNGLIFPRIDALASVNPPGITIFNDGAADLAITGINAVGGSCWLDISPPQSPPFSISPGGSETVEVDINLCVGPGTYNDTIRITSNDPDESVVDVPVSLEVTGTLPAGFHVSPTSGLMTSEIGSTAVFSVTLTAEPSGSASFSLGSTDTGEGTVSPSTLTFLTSNWDTPQPVTITGVDDAIIDLGVPFTITLGTASSSDPNYHGLNPEDVSVFNLDDDAFNTYLPLAVK